MGRIYSHLDFQRLDSQYGYVIMSHSLFIIERFSGQSYVLNVPFDDIGIFQLIQMHDWSPTNLC